MKLLLTVIFVLMSVLSTQAQFFSGKFVPDQSVDQFSYLKVHHHHNKQDKYHGDLEVKVYTEYGLLWKTEATMLSDEKAAPIVSKFEGDENVLSVYEFKIAIDGIEEDYFLLGYRMANGHPAFIVVEEIFASEAELNLVDLKSFRLMKLHDLATLDH